MNGPAPPMLLSSQVPVAREPLSLRNQDEGLILEPWVPAHALLEDHALCNQVLTDQGTTVKDLLNIQLFREDERVLRFTTRNGVSED